MFTACQLGLGHDSLKLPSNHDSQGNRASLSMNHC